MPISESARASRKSECHPVDAGLIDDVALDRLRGGLTAQWQVVRLKGEPAERFLTVHPLTQHQSPVHIAAAGLTSLKRGLDKAGIGAETFELQRDPNGPFGWRSPYRGLEALEPEDAAVFFERNADIVRGIDTLRGLAAHKPPRLMVTRSGLDFFEVKQSPGKASGAVAKLRRRSCAFLAWGRVAGPWLPARGGETRHSLDRPAVEPCPLAP